MIAVIVINYKQEVRTVGFVREELSKISLPHKVIVVDNGSTTESEAALRDGLPADVVLLPLKENVGFARGNNAAAEWAKEQLWGGDAMADDDCILFSNNDIRLKDADVVEVLARELSQHPEMAVIGPNVVGLDGKVQSPWKFWTFWQRHVSIYWSSPFMSKEKHEQAYDLRPDPQSGSCYNVSSCFFLVRARDYFRCGMMDPHTFLYAEEACLAERMKRIGMGEWFCADVTVVHEHGATIKKNYNRTQTRRMMLEAAWYYYSTYIGTPRWQLWVARWTLRFKELLGR